MPITVSSGFKSQVEDQTPTDILRQFTFANSDHSDVVLDYGSISRTGDKVTAGDLSMRVSNADQRWNEIQQNKTLFTGSATLQAGFTINNSNEVTTLFTGKLIAFKDASTGKVVLSFQDTLSVLENRFIGDSNNIISFTGSEWNPADMFWTIATSWGELSSIENTSNPDIDYNTWLDMRSRSNELGFKLQAEFSGEAVNNAFKLIGQITDTVIVGDGQGRINTLRAFPASGSVISSFNDDKVVDVTDRKMRLSNLVNDGTVLYGYNPDTANWEGSISKVKTSSVNTYGRWAKIFEDSTIWHVDSISAFSFIDRWIEDRFEPPEEIILNSTMAGILNEIDDSFTLTNAIMSYSNKGFRITKQDINLNQGTARITALDKDILDTNSWFLLDNTFQGYLDRSDNPLY